MGAIAKGRHRRWALVRSWPVDGGWGADMTRHSRLLAAGLGALAIVGIGLYPAAKAIQHRSDRCFLAFTDDQRARALGMTEGQAEVLEERGLAIESLCSWPETELARIVANVPIGGDDDPALRESWDLQRRSDDGTITPGGQSIALRQRAKMEERAKVQQMSEPIGPKSGVAGQVGTWASLGPVGATAGRISALAFDPKNADRIWAGASSGGLWVSNDGAKTWAPVASFPGTLGVSAISFNPSNPLVMYVTTGAANGTTRYSAISGGGGAGIFTSTDGGATWAALDATDPAKNSDWLNAWDVAVNPRDGNNLVAANYWGPYVSTDAGLTWKRNFYGYDPATQVRQPLTQVQFDPSTPNFILASGFGVTGYSADAGATWTVRTLPGASPGANFIRFAFARTTPGLVFAIVDLNGGTLFKSVDSGRNWTQVSTPGQNGAPAAYVIWVDPTDPNVIVIGGVDLFRSTDGGLTFVKISDWVVDANGANPSTPHADQHAIVSPPTYSQTNRRVMVATDGGVFIAADIKAVTAAKNDPNWSAANTGLSITQFYSIAGSKSGLIAGGTQDNGFLVSNGVNQASLVRTIGGDNISTFIDPASDQRVISQYPALQIQRITNAATGQYSYVCSGIPEGGSFGCNGSGKANGLSPLANDPSNSKRFYGGGASLWVTQDIWVAPQPTWTAIKAPSSVAANYISAVAVAPSNPDIVWVGYNNGELYKTANATSQAPTWTAIPTLKATRQIIKILIDKADPNAVLLGLGGYNAGNVQRTNDGGTTWTDVSDNLPYSPVYAMVADPNTPNLIYLGGEVGVFASTTKGGNWQILSGTGNPGAAMVRDLAFVPATSNLLVATYGRGVYSYTIAGAQAAVPQSGWWWNPAEGGRGYSLEVSPSNGSIFLAAYMYDTAGAPVWYVGTLTASGGGVYGGSLVQYQGGQVLGGAYRAPTGPNTVASAQLTATTSSAASLSITGGGLNSTFINIQRYSIVANGLNAPPTSTQPQTGWWWNPAEGGRGYFLEVQGGTVFLAAYMYDTNGKPIWYVSQNALTTDTAFSGSLTQYAGGQTLGGTFVAPSSSATVGGLSVQFSSPASGSLTLPNGAKVPIQRYLF